MGRKRPVFRDFLEFAQHSCFNVVLDVEYIFEKFLLRVCVQKDLQILIYQGFSLCNYLVENFSSLTN